jgi:hypothetical protein
VEVVLQLMMMLGSGGSLQVQQGFATLAGVALKFLVLCVCVCVCLHLPLKDNNNIDETDTEGLPRTCVYVCAPVYLTTARRSTASRDSRGA